MSGPPWGKFFWSDWETDTALKLCSYAAQGLWMRMLCIAAQHEPIGYVAVAGRPLDETTIARMTGGAISEVADLLDELARNGVFSRDAKGRIYSRRMIRDARKVAEARKFGKLGGNPSLGNKTGKTSTLKGEDNPTLNGGDKPQKLEARDSVAKATGGEPPDPVKIMFDMGRALLTEAGCSKDNAGSQIGKWRKAMGDGWVMEALNEAKLRSISNPVQWIEGRMKLAKTQRVERVDAVDADARRYERMDEEARQRRTGTAV